MAKSIKTELKFDKLNFNDVLMFVDMRCDIYDHKKNVLFYTIKLIYNNQYLV